MDIQQILTDLNRERNRLDQAIAALEGLSSSLPVVVAVLPERSKRKRQPPVRVAALLLPDAGGSPR